MNNLLVQNLPTVTALCREYSVESLSAFGSVLSDHFSETSDIDLLVTFYDTDNIDYLTTYLEFKKELEKLFKKEVDLIIKKDFENPVFSQNIAKNQQLLYERKCA